MYSSFLKILNSYNPHDPTFFLLLPQVPQLELSLFSSLHFLLRLHQTKAATSDFDIATCKSTLISPLHFCGFSSKAAPLHHCFISVGVAGGELLRFFLLIRELEAFPTMDPCMQGISSSVGVVIIFGGFR